VPIRPEKDKADLINTFFIFVQFHVRLVLKSAKNANMSKEKYILAKILYEYH
jgi:hypothetical protein